MTPAHPDYPSGHCAYEGAAIRVLQLFFGTDQTKASYTYPPNAITLRWASYSQIANEVGDARVWGGIHTRTADEHADWQEDRGIELHVSFAQSARALTKLEKRVGSTLVLPANSAGALVMRKLIRARPPGTLRRALIEAAGANPEASCSE